MLIWLNYLHYFNPKELSKYTQKFDPQMLGSGNFKWVFIIKLDAVNYLKFKELI